jgi:hypothetical protein
LKTRLWTFPPYSLDLMRLGDSSGHEVESRALYKKGCEEEYSSSYQQRLNLRAARLPRKLAEDSVTKMNESLKSKLSRGRSSHLGLMCLLRLQTSCILIWSVQLLRALLPMPTQKQAEVLAVVGGGNLREFWHSPGTAGVQSEYSRNTFRVQS